MEDSLEEKSSYQEQLKEASKDLPEDLPADPFPEEPAPRALGEPLKTESPKTEPPKTEPPKTDPPKKKGRPPRPRNDVLCEDCGKTYSSKTKTHVCKPPSGFVKETSQALKFPEPVLQRANTSPSLPPEPHEITLDDVRGYLNRAHEARKEQRRSTWISQLF